MSSLEPHTHPHPNDDWSTLFDRLPIGAYRSTPDGRQMRANPALVRLNGYDTEAELLQAVRDIGREWYVQPHRRQEFQTLMARDGRVLSFESEVYRHRTRERIWINENAHALRDAQGRVVCYEGTVEDISFRRQSQQAQERSAELLRQVTAGVPGIVYRVHMAPDGSRCYHFVSDGVRQLYGVTPEQVLADGMLLTRHRHPDDKADPQALSKAIGGAPVSVDFRILPAGGGLKWVRMTSRAVHVDVHGVLRDGVMLDITEAHAAEQALREADARWKSTLERLGDGVWEMDFVRRAGVMSGPLSVVYGLAQDQFQNFGDDLDQRVHPDDVESMRLARRAHLEGPAPLYVHEHRLRLPDGRWIWVLSRGLVVQRDADGRPLRMIGTHTDITERREAETLRQARDRAESADRAKSELMSRISHELRTPLNAVLGFSQLLEQDTALTAQHRAWVEHVLASGRHLLSLVDDVLDLTSSQSPSFGLLRLPVELDAAFDASWSMVAKQADAAGLVLDRSPAAGLAVLADPKRLRQVLSNLLSNAVKYNRPGGHIGFAVRRVGGEIEFELSDTGRGIAPELMDKAFQPFERLGAEHGDVPGTGLGLSLCRQWVETMGGTITLRSEPGVGSVLAVRLPAASSA